MQLRKKLQFARKTLPLIQIFIVLIFFEKVLPLVQLILLLRNSRLRLPLLPNKAGPAHLDLTNKGRFWLLVPRKF